MFYKEQRHYRCSLPVTCRGTTSVCARLQALLSGTVQTLGGSCRFGKGRVCIGKPVKSMPELGAERAILDGAAHPEQEIGPAS
jgi:hypothetical protein